jgi:hypothetical protein
MRMHLIGSAAALALIVPGALSLPGHAAEAAVDVDAGTRSEPARPIPRDQVDVDRHPGGVDVTVDRDPAPRMPPVDKPGVDVDVPGADVEVGR